VDINGSKGTVVMVANDKANPAEVEIEVGQTVFFAIVAGRGITITDRRLHTVGDCLPQDRKSAEAR
jgi:hypothetical protein